MSHSAKSTDLLEWKKTQGHWFLREYELTQVSELSVDAL